MTLSEAQYVCNQIKDCGGITLVGDEFELRGGTKPVKSEDSENSWLKGEHLPKPEVKPEVELKENPKVKPEVNSVEKLEVKQEVKPEIQPEIKQEKTQEQGERGGIREKFGEIQVRGRPNELREMFEKEKRWRAEHGAMTRDQYEMMMRMRDTERMMRMRGDSHRRGHPGMNGNDRYRGMDLHYGNDFHEYIKPVAPPCLLPPSEHQIINEQVLLKNHPNLRGIRTCINGVPVYDRMKYNHINELLQVT